jgi:hypothetical protein
MTASRTSTFYLPLQQSVPEAVIMEAQSAYTDAFLKFFDVTGFFQGRWQLDA